MIRLISLIALLCLAGVSGALYKLKYKVQALDREAVALQRQILAEREAIRLLDADWAYLNQPDRLQALAERHLTLAPINPRQFAMISTIPARMIPLGDIPVTPSERQNSQALPPGPMAELSSPGLNATGRPQARLASDVIGGLPPIVSAGTE
jgi:hypothetical protein